jgi:hypothetical protein
VVPRAGITTIITTTTTTTTTTTITTEVIMAPIRGVLKGLVAIKKHHSCKATFLVRNNIGPSTLSARRVYF